MPEVEGSPIGEPMAQSYGASSNLCILKMPLASLVSDVPHTRSYANPRTFSQLKSRPELKK